MIPAMKNHLIATGSLKGGSKQGTSGHTSPFEDITSDEDSSAIFREQFCVAAQALADEQHVSLHELGELSNEIMMTGTTTDNGARSVSAKDEKDTDAELGSSTALWGKGQVLFIIRRVDDTSANKLMDLGFRFAVTPSNVLDIMARHMQVKKPDLFATVDSLRRSSLHHVPKSLDVELVPGNHYISLFALRPGFKSYGCRWDVLVYSEKMNMIPSYALGAGGTMSSSVTTFLQSFAGRTPEAIYQHLERSAETKQQYDADFVIWMTGAISALQDALPESLHESSLFCPTPVTVPCTSSSGTSGVATVWAFTVIPDVHDSSLKGVRDSFTWIPFSFFQCLQRVAKDSADHGVLARKNHCEFHAMFSKFMKDPPMIDAVASSPSLTDALTKKFKRAHRVSSRHDRSTTSTIVPTDNSSENELVRIPSLESSSDPSFVAHVREQSASTNPFGGIMVSQDIVVNNSIKGSDIGLKDLGVSAHVGVANQEQPTWADQLYSILYNRWLNVGIREYNNKRT
jgi:hypothetical protein